MGDCGMCVKRKKKSKRLSMKSNARAVRGLELSIQFSLFNLNSSMTQ